MNSAAVFAREIRSRWKPRKKNSHKGDFGKVFILAGSKGLTGAARLSAMAALRSGAGLVTLGVPETVYQVVARHEPEIMVRPFPATKAGTFSMQALRPCLEFLKTQDILALGPGLSAHPETQRWVRELLKRARIPVIIDADGINALTGNLSALKYCSGNSILTPHPVEFFRAFGTRVSADAKDRKAKASAAARGSGAVIVLKGYGTVVASPAGKTFVNPTGNPGMAKGGSGDVLTGMIAAIAAQGFPLWDAACFAVYLHGLSADMAVRKTGEAGMIAGDIVDFIAPAIKKVRGV